jgi:hypothetical protein
MPWTFSKTIVSCKRSRTRAKRLSAVYMEGQEENPYYISYSIAGIELSHYQQNKLQQDKNETDISNMSCKRQRTKLLSAVSVLEEQKRKPCLQYTAGAVCITNVKSIL